jgi:hypothetical protein
LANRDAAPGFSDPRQLLFLPTPATAELPRQVNSFVAAGFARGALRHDANQLALWIPGTFILLQIAAGAYIVWRLTAQGRRRQRRQFSHHRMHSMQRFSPQWHFTTIGSNRDRAP